MTSCIYRNYMVCVLKIIYLIYEIGTIFAVSVQEYKRFASSFFLII